jgi:hypothetical protein
VLSAPGNRAQSSNDEDWARCVVGSVGRDHYPNRSGGGADASNSRCAEIVGLVNPSFRLRRCRSGHHFFQVEVSEPSGGADDWSVGAADDPGITPVRLVTQWLNLDARRIVALSARGCRRKNYTRRTREHCQAKSRIHAPSLIAQYFL